MRGTVEGDHHDLRQTDPRGAALDEGHAALLATQWSDTRSSAARRAASRRSGQAAAMLPWTSVTLSARSESAGFPVWRLNGPGLGPGRGTSRACIMRHSGQQPDGHADYEGR